MRTPRQGVHGTDAAPERVPPPNPYVPRLGLRGRQSERFGCFSFCGQRRPGRYAREAGVRAGTYVYDGPALVTGWHSHDLHQLKYALQGIVEVETDAAHYLLPPQQAAWIPAGLSHRSTLSRVKTVSVFFAPSLVPDKEGRARILAAAPVIREMIFYAVRWPIDQPRSDPVADPFFIALAVVVFDWLTTSCRCACRRPPTLSSEG